MISRISMALICTTMLIVFGCDMGPPQVQPPQGRQQPQALAAPAPAGDGSTGRPGSGGR